jgi:ABC-type Fe3+ transport system permease subunit
MGAIFFFILTGASVAPAVLDAARNVTFSKTLSASLPEGVKRMANEETISSLGNQDALLSERAMAALKEKFSKQGDEGQVLFQQTVQAIRNSMLAGLRSVFLIAAITMLLAFLVICTIPEGAMDQACEEEVSGSVPASQPAAAE